MRGFEKFSKSNEGSCKMFWKRNRIGWSGTNFIRIYNKVLIIFLVKI